MDGESCKNCKFYLEFTEIELKDDKTVWSSETSGRCRRNPPIYFRDYDTYWLDQVHIHETEWCGEWKPVPKKDKSTPKLEILPD